MVAKEKKFKKTDNGYGRPDSEKLSENERKEIELHKYYLSIKAGYDVGWEFTHDDWMKNHSKQWRQHNMKKDSEAEIKEILKHKWIESEKAGHDQGESAVFDWIGKYADKWRKSRKPKK
jgi:hypothetical protein